MSTLSTSVPFINDTLMSVCSSNAAAASSLIIGINDVIRFSVYFRFVSFFFLVYLIKLSLFYKASCFKMNWIFLFVCFCSGAAWRSEATRFGPDADRSAAVLSIFRRDRRGWPEHLRHLHVRVRDAPDSPRAPLQPRVPRQMHRQMAQGIPEAPPLRLAQLFSMCYVKRPTKP